MNTNENFIMKPIFANLKEQGLKLQDILIYVTIRSFYNSTDNLCYPTYEEISTICGYSNKVIKASIERLQFAGFMKVGKVGNTWGKNIFTFNQEGDFHKVPSDIFEANELTPNEKACLLLLTEYSPDYTLQVGIKQIITYCGLSQKSLNRHYKALIAKGYVAEHVYFNEDLKVYMPFIIISNDWIEWFDNQFPQEKYAYRLSQ